MNMKAEEPTLTYGLPNSQLEALRDKLIASIRKLTDVQLLMQCDKLLNPAQTQKSEEEAEDEDFAESVRGAVKEYRDYLQGKHKFKSEEEFWNEFYKVDFSD